MRTSRRIDDQQESGHEREENDGCAEDCSRWPTLDQGRDEDSTNALGRLVEPLGGTHLKRRTSVGHGSRRSDKILRTLGEGVSGLEPVGSESGNGTIEDLEAQLVEHDTSDIDNPIKPIKPLSLAWRKKKMT